MPLMFWIDGSEPLVVNDDVISGNVAIRQYPTHGTDVVQLVGTQDSASHSTGTSLQSRHSKAEATPRDTVTTNGTVKRNEINIIILLFT